MPISFPGLPWMDYFPIQTKSDLPTPVLGIINLLDGFYQLNGFIDIDTTPMRIAEGGIVDMRGFDAFLDGFIYTGTGPMISTDGKDILTLALIELFVVSPLADVLDIDSATQNEAAIFINAVGFAEVKSPGIINNVKSFVLNNVEVTNFNDGFLLSNIRNVTMGILLFQGGKDTGGVHLTVDGTIDNITIGVSVIFKPESTEFALDIKSTSVVAQGSVLGNQFDLSAGGGAFAPGSNDQTKVGWKYTANPGISDSQTLGSYFMEANATTTIIPVSGAWIIIAGTTTQGASERASMTADNQATFENKDVQKGAVWVAMTASTTVGTFTSYSFSVFKNGIQLPGSLQTRDINNRASSIPLIGPTTFVATDVFDVRVRNNNDSRNILFPSLSVMVLKAG